MNERSVSRITDDEDARRCAEREHGSKCRREEKRWKKSIETGSTTMTSFRVSVAID